MEQMKYLHEQAELDFLSAKMEDERKLSNERITILETEKNIIAEAITQEQFLLNDCQWQKIKYENLQMALRLQFSEMKQADFRNAVKELNEMKLAPHIFPKNDIPNSWWTRLCNQTQWFRGELSRYMKPLALIFVIPGIIQTIKASQKIADVTGCDMTAVFTDNCSPAQEVDVMSQEIWIWMWVSFPLLFFYALLTLLNGVTYPFEKLQPIRNWVYEKIHKPYEKWCTREDLWFYKEYVWRMLSPFLLSGTMIFSILRSIDFADRYAFLMGCESLFHTIEMTYQNKDSLECTAATQGMIIATFVGAAEIGKFYLLYVLEFYGVYGLTHLLEKCIDFKKCFNQDKVHADMDEFIEQDKFSMKVAASAIFLSGSVNLIPAKKLGDEIFHAGLKIAVPLPNLNDTISKLNPNATIDTNAFFHEICPEDNFVTLLNESIPNAHLPQNITWETIKEFLNETSQWKFPAVIINNNTLVYTLAEACLNTGLINSLFMNIIQNDPDCNELVTIRALGAAIAFFYLNASLTGAAAYFLASIVQRINYFCKKLCCYQAKLERSTEESVPIMVNVIHDNEEKKDLLSDLREPLLQASDYKHSENSWNLFNKKNKPTESKNVNTPSQSLSPRSPSIV